MMEPSQVRKTDGGSCSSSCSSCAKTSKANTPEPDGPVLVGKSLVLASTLAFGLPLLLAVALVWISQSFLPQTPIGQACIAGFAVAGVLVGGGIAAMAIKWLNKQEIERIASDSIGQ